MNKQNKPNKERNVAQTNKKPSSSNANYSPQRSTKLSPQEISRRKRKIIEKKRQRRELFILKLVIFLTFYILINLIIAGFIFFSIKNRDETTKINRLEIVFDESQTVKLPGDALVKNNTVYIPFEKLDLLCKFVLTGDSSKITLIMNSGIDYTSFYKDSNLAYIGGASYRISAPVLFEKDDYYIPLDFVNNYIEGIAVDYDEKVNIYRLVLTGEPITFAGKFPSSTEKIDQKTAPQVPLPETSDTVSQ